MQKDGVWAMGKIYLSTKNNLLKLQNSIKEYKNGQMLIEEKELILKILFS